MLIVWLCYLLLWLYYEFPVDLCDVFIHILQDCFTGDRANVAFLRIWVEFMSTVLHLGINSNLTWMDAYIMVIPGNASIRVLRSSILTYNSTFIMDIWFWGHSTHKASNVLEYVSGIPEGPVWPSMWAHVYPQSYVYIHWKPSINNLCCFQNFVSIELKIITLLEIG